MFVSFLHIDSFAKNLIFILIFFSLTYLYNAHTSKKPILSVVSLSFVYALPLVYGFYLTHNALNIEFVTLFILYFLLKISIVILKDYRDVVGDSMYNKQTFLLQFGYKTVAYVSLLLGTSSLLLLGTMLYFFHYNIFLLVVLFIITTRLIYFRLKLFNHNKNNVLHAVIVTYNQNMFDLIFLLCFFF